MCKWGVEKELECSVESNLTEDSVKAYNQLEIEQGELKSGKQCPLLPHMDDNLYGSPYWECSNHTNDSSICLKKCINDPDSVEGLVKQDIPHVY